MLTGLFIAIAHWRVKHEVALAESRLHLLNDLTTVLLTLKLPLCSVDDLNKLTLWRVGSFQPICLVEPVRKKFRKAAVRKSSWAAAFEI